MKPNWRHQPYPQPFAESQDPKAQCSPIRFKMSLPKIDTSHLNRQLTGPVDPSLQDDRTKTTEVFQRPPDVNTLREWGQCRLPSGKHQGKTFEQAYLDRGYVYQLKNRVGVSTWVKSFQNYSRARTEMDYQHTLYLQRNGSSVTLDMVTQASCGYNPVPSPQIKPKAVPVPQATPKAAPKDQESSSSEAWIKIEEKSPVESTKRPAPKPKASEAQPAAMQHELNSERIHHLQTQIAVLQRELAREVEIPDESEDI